MAISFWSFFCDCGIFIVWFLWNELYTRKLWFWVLVGISLYAVAVGLDFVVGLDNEPYEGMGIAGFFSTTDSRIRHMSIVEEFQKCLEQLYF